MKKKYSVIYLLLLFVCSVQSQSLRETALTAIQNLEDKIALAEAENLVVEKEKMTLRTAKISIFFSDWDDEDDNRAINLANFGRIYTYQNSRIDAEGRNLNTIANDLPAIQRQGIITIVNQAIQNIDDLRSGTLVRKDAVTLNWQNISIKNINGEERIVETRDGVDVPVLVYDYIFKPTEINAPEETLSLTEYHGDMNELFVGGNFLRDGGALNPFFTNNRIPQAINRNTFGQVFFGHNLVPRFIQDRNRNRKSDKQSIYAGERLFTTYDIDNPDTKQIWRDLIAGFADRVKDAKVTNLGYLLANEPHWSTSENTFDNGAPRNPRQQAECDADPFCNDHTVSYFTMEKFVAYLKNIYGDSSTGLATLNQNWFGNDTSKYYANFDAINGPLNSPNYGFEIPFSKSLVGTPSGYDWMLFNKTRTLEWFTFLHDEVQKIDTDAKTHIKLIPRYFIESIQSAGLDMEKLINLQEIIGHDATIAQQRFPFGIRTTEWEERYNFDWYEMAMYFDFAASVKPNAINYNSEQHYLSSGPHRDVYLQPKYARATIWLAAMYGENASFIWYWPRNEDGSMRNDVDRDYAGSITHQPMIMNEVGSTMYDLNIYADEIYNIKNARKPIRVFYSQTSAIDKTTHMQELFDLYEYMNFDGIPLGFATENIINTQNNQDWDVITVYKTQFVTDGEFNALQQYLDNGGTVIIDAESFTLNEYGVNRTQSLNTNNGGRLISSNSLASMRELALNEANTKNGVNPISVQEDQSLTTRGCFWRTTKDKEGNDILSIVNMRKGNSSIDIELNGSSDITVTDLLTGKTMPASFVMEPTDSYILKIEDATLSTTENEIIRSIQPSLYPNPTENIINIDLVENYRDTKLSIYDISGRLQLISTNPDNVSKLTVTTDNLSSGIYIVEVKTSDERTILKTKLIKK